MKVGRGKLIVDMNRLWSYMSIGCLSGGNIWLSDDTFWGLSFCKLFDMVKEFVVDNEDFIPQINDCDNYAHKLQQKFMDERLRVYKEDGKEAFQYAFGEVWANKLKGKPVSHAVNIAWTKDEGLVLIEPQTAEMWIASKDDNPYYVRF